MTKGKIVKLFGLVIILSGLAYFVWQFKYNLSGILPSPTPDVSDLIHVSKPLSGGGVNDPIIVEGEARGNWFFEASFPVSVIDANGKLITSGIATTKSNWMTTEFVPFRAELKFFVRPETLTGTLILHNDNPSDLRENDRELRLPIVFDFVKRAVKLYYYDPSKDKDASGNILCSAQGLVPVLRDILRTSTPIQDTINLFLLGKLTNEEKKRGITTEYPLQGFSLVGAAQKGGVLTLEFADPQHKTSGGACRVGILRAQLEATAKQFPGNSKIKIIPEELFQP